MKGIHLNNVSFSYPEGNLALKNINLRIKPGENIAIMGKNGAGKSTLMKLINGLLIPTTGKIYVDGKSTTDYSFSELTKKVGVMFQNPEHQLFSNSVEDELNFSLKNLNLSDKDYRKYKIEIIKKLELEDLLNRSPYNLSGGQRKKVSIATILVRKPEYLLFDEPTTGADRIQRKILEQIILSEKKLNNTLIIITHDTEFAYKNTSRLIVLQDGEILSDGPTEEIFTNETIIRNSSLILPQIFRLKKEIKNIYNNDSLNEILKNIKDFGKLYEFIIKSKGTED